MTLKLINATEIREGTCIIVDGNPCIVRSYDISKSGKHGASKLRAEAIGIFDGKKKVVTVPGHERFEVPAIRKLKGQILSITDEKASLMDLETFETLDVVIDSELKGTLNESDSVEYWDVESIGKIIKRKM